jgi:hypothetical protein
MIVKTNHWLKHDNFIEAFMNGRLIGQSHETLNKKIVIPSNITICQRGIPNQNVLMNH